MKAKIDYEPTDQELNAAIEYADKFAEMHWYKMKEYQHDLAVELDDLKQECRIALWQALRNFKGMNDAKLSTFSYSVLKNTLSKYDEREVGMFTPKQRDMEDIFDHHQALSLDYITNKEKVGRSMTFHDLLGYYDKIEDQINTEQIKDVVEGLVDELPDPINVRIVKEVFLEGRSQDEVADELDIDQSNISRRMHKSLTQLQELADYYNINTEVL